jgi:hypothetical protein
VGTVDVKVRATFEAMARLLRWALIAGGLGGLGWLVARLLRSPELSPATAGSTTRGTTAPVATPAPVVAPVVAEPVAEAVPAPDDATTWVAPEGESCPVSHPVKAKESSGIYHVPGGLSYDRTVADRCYSSEAAAEADGYRRAKR